MIGGCSSVVDPVMLSAGREETAFSLMRGADYGGDLRPFAWQLTTVKLLSLQNTTYGLQTNMRRGFIDDVKEVFQTAINNLSQENFKIRESERNRILKLQRDVISYLHKFHRVEKSMEDSGFIKPWGQPDPDRRSYDNENGEERSREDDIDWGDTRR